MLHAGLDLSRKRLDFHLLDQAGVTVEIGAAPPDGDGLRGLAARISRHRQPLRAAIESMTGARFVHDQLELHGWEVRPMSNHTPPPPDDHALLHREGVDGSSPSEGSSEKPANAGLSSSRSATTKYRRVHELLGRRSKRAVFASISTELLSQALPSRDWRSGPHPRPVRKLATLLRVPRVTPDVTTLIARLRAELGGRMHPAVPLDSADASTRGEQR
jgi:hypothetical protein